MRYASAFAGLGGFDVSFDRVGMTPTAQVEIDKNCLKILNRHWPTVPKLEDIRDVSGPDLGRPDLICGGFPCTDTSIAAPHRKGLAGSRSGLFFEFVRLLDEQLRLVDATQPRWVVIENTEGLLKSNDGRDMAAVIDGLAQLRYGLAYRVVDGRHLGTPQRRRRVLVVGHLGGDPRPAWQVLGDSGAGRKADQAHPVSRSTNGPRAVPGPVGAAGAVIWRKSARARKALDKGGYETWVSDGDGNTLTGFDGGGPLRQTHLVYQHGRVRTLSLTEWERLQGFEDGWTAGIPDSARQLALGNAISTHTSGWLARRLMAVDAALPQIGARA